MRDAEQKLAEPLLINEEASSHITEAVRPAELVK